MKRRTILALTVLISAFSLMAAGCGEGAVENENTGSQTEVITEAEPEVSVQPDESIMNTSEEEQEESARSDELNIDGVMNDPEADPWKKAYAEFVLVCSRGEGYKYYDDGSCLTYNLIYADEDDIPELAVGRNWYDVSLFTYVPGEEYAGVADIKMLMEAWGYGVQGNTGYAYHPYENLIHCRSTIQGGPGYYCEYWTINENKEMVKLHSVRAEYDHEKEEYCGYFYNDTEVSKEKFDEYFLEGQYRDAEGYLESCYMQSEQTAEDVIAEMQNMEYGVLIDEVLAAPKTEEWKKAYVKIMDAWEEGLVADYHDGEDIRFSLVYINEDEIPELAVGTLDWVYLYTYCPGETAEGVDDVTVLMEDWSWGTSSNTGYEYVKGENIIMNENSDPDRYEIQFYRVEENGTLTEWYSMWYDIERNAEGFTYTYFYAGKEVPEDEWFAHTYKDETFELIYGEETGDEVIGEMLGL